MTSNVGGDIKGDGLGFQPADRAGKTNDQLRQHFTPEFLGRLDQVVCFTPLQGQAMEKIAEKYLRQLQTRIAAGGLQLQLPEELPGILGGMTGKKDGARQLRRIVREKVESPLSEYLLKSDKKASRIHGIWKDGQLQFRS